jgi:hypothetical protein
MWKHSERITECLKDFNCVKGLSIKSSIALKQKKAATEGGNISRFQIVENIAANIKKMYSFQISIPKPKLRVF